ncbi:DUF3426 domain-containing protein [Corallococcus sp. bb12-1]|uniref:DUF3426 domain-containing protein n=1 Tax=Corallococcus sp. bb12-1 TaxID=2996784 RepID=UPI00226DBC76|nr:DUF3426 domain-containing protein [Corallococcus sp. bb12-1]MCY1042614.1 DUF3426 domain-containing protein [Corallococcus sp. bb12-1]
MAREPAPDLRAPLPVPAPAEQADPFQAFGDAPEPTGEVTRPGSAYYAPGGPGAPGAKPSPARSWGDVDVDIDVDDAPAAPVRAPATSGVGGPLTPFDAPMPPPGVAARRQVAPAPVAPPVNLSGLNEEDPFADFMSDVGPLPAPASAPPVASPAPAPRPVASAGPGAPPRPSVTGLRSVPPGAFAPPAPAPRPAPPGAFAAGPPGALRPSAGAPVVPPSGPGAFGASSAPVGLDGSLGEPSARPSAPGAFPAGPSARPSGPGPGASAPSSGARAGASSQPRTAPSPAGRPAPVAAAVPAAAPDPLFDFSLDDAPAAAPPAANTVVTAPPRGALPPTPAAPAPSYESEDPFASIDMAAPSADLSAPAPEDPPPAAPSDAMGDLFDFSGGGASGEEGMAASDTGRAALLGDVPAQAAPDADGVSLLGEMPAYDDGDPFKITTPRREVVDLASMRGGPAVTVTKPSARLEDVGMPQRRLPGRARKLTGFVVNLTVATVLVVALGALGIVYLRDGQVDASTLSPDRLRTLVMPPARPFTASDVSNGLYATRDGRMLFVVRGEAENRTGAAASVRVRAALFDGEQRVRSTEGLAGALATPEDLYAVTNAEAATALRQRLDAASLPVPPGGKVPFLVVFQEYPADLAGFRLEVTLEPAPSAPTADRTGE